MDLFRNPRPQSDVPDPQTAAGPQSSDPRLQPRPDYGTLGPGSDFARSAGQSLPSAGTSPTASQQSTLANRRLLQFVAITAGALVALVTSHSAGSVKGWKKFNALFTPPLSATSSTAGVSERDLDRQKPQKQAEILLTRAVALSNDGAEAKTRAEEQIQSRVEQWRGKLTWNTQLSQLTTAALNSSDDNVRSSAIEVQLAAYGLKKNDTTVEALVRRADSSDHSQKIWALWSLGLLGNRGIETDRVVEILEAHLKDPGRTSQDEDARRWAVEGLALVGTPATIPPLLAAMHDDPSPLVRERAACSLAESGMLSREQRAIAVPQLISYTDDPALDAQTQGWAFQALGDITKQRLPNDSEAWRTWYRESVPNRQ